jgi:TyrR family helix-turn-helix protein/PAS domain S-box-containing protein
MIDRMSVLDGVRHLIDSYILQIGFNDRIGLGYEILSLLKEKNINLLAMEAKAGEQMVIKFHCDSDLRLQQIMADLKGINGIHSVQVKELMPYEKREHQLTTILNSVNEGIIAINENGVLTHINEMARNILHLEKRDVIGFPAKRLIKEKLPILDTIKTGESYHLMEVKSKKGDKTVHYLSSGVPILNNKGRVIGAVATIKDFKQVEEIISKVDGKMKAFTFDKIVYQSSGMKKIVETAKIVAKGTSSILLRGESGTGKELFARAIHLESCRSREPFIAINCAALPESLLESELFGYEEGAFTGAIKGGKKGLFEQANKGTLFLDEIGELSTQMQVRLLRVLQEGTVRRIGGNKEISIDVRIISATHRLLEEMISDHTFRLDLYYRLNVVPIHIPPLRKRKEDIPIIAQYLIRKICHKLKKQEKFLTSESLRYLMNLPWPGNVRQLENTLELLINVVENEKISMEDIVQWSNFQSEKTEISEPMGNDNFTLQCSFKKKWPTLKEVVDEVEKELISQVLESHLSSRKAGSILGVSNTTILNKMKKHGFSAK